MLAPAATHPCKSRARSRRAATFGNLPTESWVSPNEMLETGDAIDRYTVDRLLGEGGMADVYRVRHRTLGTPAALKVLRMSGRFVHERLVQEGQVQAGLRHPNIVEVRDVLEVSGFPALLLELVEGPSLEALLMQGRLPFEEAEEIFRGILLAVEHAHKQGLVHRDLKPGNVLLAPRLGGGWTPKVADFGLARVIQEDDATMRKTRSGIAMGTPRYMSPEQIRDAKNVDQRTDIFALGAILYELVCGEAAFERSDIAAIFNATLSGSYKSPASLAPGVPERALRAIDASLKTRREQRLPDCATFRSVLDGAVYSPPPDTSTVAVPDVPAAPRTLVSADTIDLGSASTRSVSRTNSPSMLGAAVVGGGVVAGGVVLIGIVLIGLGWWLFAPAAAPPVAVTSELPTPKPAGIVPDLAKPTGEATVPVATTPGSSPAKTTTGPRSGGSTPDAAVPPVTTPTAAALPAAPGSSTSPANNTPNNTPDSTPTPAPAASIPALTAAAPAEASPSPTKAAAPTKSITPRTTTTEVVAENATVGARVSFSGDATKVWLVGPGGRRVARGVVPEGRYDIEADFGDGEKTGAGEVDLAVGDDVSLDCSKAFKRCKVKK